MGWAGRLLVGLVAVVLSLGAASAAMASGTHRGQCEQIWPTNSRQEGVAPPADGAHITVPVIVRYMKHREPQHARPVRDAFPPEKLETLFGPNGGVNQIWRQAGIRFFIYRIEECRYGLRDFGLQRETDRTRVDDCEDLFQKVNRAYAFGDFGLDLSIWHRLVSRRLGSSVGGYASSHRAGGALLGAAWLTSTCAMQNCDQLVAHEIGHFLGLCHQCYHQARPTPCPVSMCQTPSARPCTDSDVNRHLLMRGDYRGRLLTPDEVQVARGKAAERVRPSTP